jgi:hypothetical protein
MELAGSRTLRCRTNPSHADFVTAQKRCRCGSGLEASCKECGQFFSYGHVREHEKLKICKKHDSDDDDDERVRSGSREQKVTTFGYWASDWQLGSGKKPFEISPRGQLWDGLPTGFPRAFANQMRVHAVTDQSMKGTEWMDSYDAVFARLACDPLFELVRVFSSWEKVESFVGKVLERDANATAEASKMRVLVLGNWVHEVAQAVGTLQIALDWQQKLQTFELLTGCRVFPPLDYAVTFARKELVEQMLSTTCLKKVRRAKSIPTQIVLSQQDVSKITVLTKGEVSLCSSGQSVDVSSTCEW